jgi:hypothetical protein
MQEIRSKNGLKSEKVPMEVTGRSADGMRVLRGGRIAINRGKARVANGHPLLRINVY